MPYRTPPRDWHDGKQPPRRSRYLTAKILVALPDGITPEDESQLRSTVRKAINAAAERIERLDPDIDVGTVTATVDERG